MHFLFNQRFVFVSSTFSDLLTLLLGDVTHCLQEHLGAGCLANIPRWLRSLYFRLCTWHNEPSADQSCAFNTRRRWWSGSILISREEKQAACADSLKQHCRKNDHPAITEELFGFQDKKERCFPSTNPHNPLHRTVTDLLERDVIVSSRSRPMELQRTHSAHQSHC